VSTVRVTYRKSSIGYAWDQKATVAALGCASSITRSSTRPPRRYAAWSTRVRHLVAVNGEPADSPAGVALLQELATESENAA